MRNGMDRIPISFRPVQTIGCYYWFALGSNPKSGVGDIAVAITMGLMMLGHREGGHDVRHRVEAKISVSSALRKNRYVIANIFVATKNKKIANWLVYFFLRLRFDWRLGINNHLDGAVVIDYPHGSWRIIKGERPRLLLKAGLLSRLDQILDVGLDHGKIPATNLFAALHDDARRRKTNLFEKRLHCRYSGPGMIVMSPFERLTEQPSKFAILTFCNQPRSTLSSFRRRPVVAERSGDKYDS